MIAYFLTSCLFTIFIYFQIDNEKYLEYVLRRDNYSENGNLGASALQSQASKMTGSIDILWCFSLVKGTLDDDVTKADVFHNQVQVCISTFIAVCLQFQTIL